MNIWEHAIEAAKIEAARIQKARRRRDWLLMLAIIGATVAILILRSL